LSPTEFINVPSSNSSKKLKIEVEENLFESGTSEDVILNLTQEKNKDDSSKKSEVKCPDFIVGKYCEKQKNQNRYGAPAAVSNLSQPSNEMANQMFQSVFKKAIAQVCDVTMKKEVPKAPPGEENSESFKTYA
jgi:hypothetical protein